MKLSVVSDNREVATEQRSIVRLKDQVEVPRYEQGVVASSHRLSTVSQMVALEQLLEEKKGQTIHGSNDADWKNQYDQQLSFHALPTVANTDTSSLTLNEDLYGDILCNFRLGFHQRILRIIMLCK